MEGIELGEGEDVDGEEELGGDCEGDEGLLLGGVELGCDGEGGELDDEGG